MNPNSKSPLVNVARVTAAIGKEQALQDAILATVAATRSEAGNIDFILHASADNPRHFLLLEYWEDESALSAHMKNSTFVAFSEKAKREELLDGEADNSHWFRLDAPVPGKESRPR